MVRRRFFQLVIALGSFVFSSKTSVKGLLGSPLQRSSASQRLTRIPSSLDESIRTKDAKLIVQYVLQHEQEARDATIDQKITMLKVMRDYWNAANKDLSKPRGLGTCGKAGFIILRDEENKPSELSKVVEGVGRTWISTNVSYFSDPGLRRIAQKGISQ